jgi:transcriptional regulator with XRE-family HTH domain
MKSEYPFEEKIRIAVKKLTISRGSNQRLADLAGTRPAHLTAWKNGKRSIPIPVYLRLIKLCGYSLTLYRGDAEIESFRETVQKLKARKPPGIKRTEIPTSSA